CATPPVFPRTPTMATPLAGSVTAVNVVGPLWTRWRTTSPGCFTRMHPGPERQTLPLPHHSVSPCSMRPTPYCCLIPVCSDVVVARTARRPGTETGSSTELCIFEVYSPGASTACAFLAERSRQEPTSACGHAIAESEHERPTAHLHLGAHEN